MPHVTRRAFLRESAAGAGFLSGLKFMNRTGDGRGAENSFSQNETENDLAARLSRISPRHPSLHFDASGLEELRRKSRNSHKRYADMLLVWVDANRGWSPRDFPYPEGREVALEQCAAFVTNSALAFLISENDDYLALTRRWVNGMYEYPVEDANNYGFPIFAAGLARVYDWLYDYLSEDEQTALRERITDITARSYRGGLAGTDGAHWWANWNLHHDHWIPVGGYGEAALALLGEVEEAAAWAAAAKLDFDYSLSWLGKDGAWHEGAADWCYTLAPLLWFYGAWESVTGENLHGNPWIKNTAAYRLYHWLPDDTYINLNDSFRSGRYNTSGSASCHLLHRLASLFDDGHAQWLAERDEAFDMKPAPKGVYQAPYENFSFAGKPVDYPYPQSQCVGWNLLWYNPRVKPVSPDSLPAARHFDNQGVVIMRTGWDINSAVASFSCAPLAGQKYAAALRTGKRNLPAGYTHAQADYTSFSLFTGGGYRIIPPGYARRSSWFQNVVSVNGADFLYDPALDVRITAFTAERNFIYTAADAAAAFPENAGVESYIRHLLFYENEWLFIFDDLRLNALGRRGRSYNRFGWSVHSNPETDALSLSGAEAVWKRRTGGSSPLRLFLLEPAEAAWEQATFRNLENRNMLEALRVVKSEWYADRMRMLTAFSWKIAAERPGVVKTGQYIAAFEKNDDANPAVGFSFSPGERPGKLHPDLKDRGLILFGHNPDKPGDCLRIGG